jgi:hypothetical protein
MNESPRQLRLSSRVRGVFIGVILIVYGFLVQRSGAGFIEGLLIAAALQGGVLLLRRHAPDALVPQATYLLELIADGVTVLLFALGVFGGIARPPMDL